MKIVGTAAPLAALKSRSRSLKDEPNGTIDTAFLFLDWLERCGHSAWQLLPLSETHLEPGSATTHVPSPYKGYGVGLDPRYLPNSRKDLEPTEAELDRFRKAQAEWVEDYILFCALRDHFGTDDWTTWDKSIRLRRTGAMQYWTKRLHTFIHAHLIEQWRLHEAFSELREEARRRGILIVGDLPFYPPLQSPLVWAHQRLFSFRPDGSMKRVSGITAGPKSHFGRQVWGHPVYRWGWMRTRDILTLWKLRIRYFAQFFDTMRLDHGKGFFSFGAMHPTDPSRDRIMKGPGKKALEDIVIFARRIELELFAEDAGDRLEELRATLHRLGVPGIRMLRFAYNENRKKIEHDYADVRNYPENAYAYTSTHDTITLMSYVKKLSEKEKRHLCAHTGVTYTEDEELLAVRLREAAAGSPARVTIVPVQDWLLTETRINVPGTEKAVGDPNWRYRIEVPVEDLPVPGF